MLHESCDHAGGYCSAERVTPNEFVGFRAMSASRHVALASFDAEFGIAR